MMPSSEALCASAGPCDEIADRVDARARWCAARRRPCTRPRSSSSTPASSRPSAVDVRAAAGGDHQVVDLGRLRAVGEAHAGARRPARPRSGVPVWTAMPWRLRPRSTRREMSASSAGQHAVEHLQQQHLAAQPREARGDLRARGPGADDRQARGQLWQRPRLLGADHAPAELHAGDRPRDRAGGEDHRGGARARARRRARGSPPPARCRRAARRATASPSIRSIPFFLNRPPTPPVSVETTFSRRACTAA